MCEMEDFDIHRYNMSAIDTIDWRFFIKPCPWCKKTPRLSLGTDRYEEAPFVWFISCCNDGCMVNPSTKAITIRKTQRYNVGIMYYKIRKLIDLWNTGNKTEVVDVTTVDPLTLKNIYKKRSC